MKNLAGMDDWFGKLETNHLCREYKFKNYFSNH